MAADGWVERCVSEIDRRAKTVHRTGKAIELTRGIKQVATSLRGEILKGIPAAEIEQTTRLLSQIKRRLEQLDT